MSAADKTRFIKELAKFLAEDSAMKGIALSLENPKTKAPPAWAHQWSRLRAMVPGLFGYVTPQEAELILRKVLA